MERTLLLVCTGGPLEGHRFVVTEAGLRIGRAPESEVVLRDAEISREHARVFLHNSAVWVQDAGSRNGVFVNDRRVARPRQIGFGDSLTLGSHRFTLEAGSGTRGRRRRARGLHLARGCACGRLGRPVVGRHHPALLDTASGRPARARRAGRVGGPGPVRSGVLVRGPRPRRRARARARARGHGVVSGRAPRVLLEVRRGGRVERSVGARARRAAGRSGGEQRYRPSRRLGQSAPRQDRGGRGRG